MARVILCKDCGGKTKHYALQLCASCYHKQHQKKEHVKERKRKWAKGNYQRLKPFTKQYREDTKEEYKKRRKEYNKRLWANEEYKKKRKIQQKEYDQKPEAIKKRRLRNNRVGRKLYRNIGSKISLSIKSGKDGKKWETLVDFNLINLKIHLEKQFKKGMNWKNYGEWHIDHRIPNSWFSYKYHTDKEFKECWSLRNLQPKWEHDNCSKKDRYAEPTLNGWLE